MRKEKVLLDSDSNSLMDKQFFAELAPIEFQKIFKKFDHAIVVVDLNGYIVFANDAFSRLLGLRKADLKELVGKEMSELYLRSSLAFFVEHVQKIVEKGKQWSGELDFVTQSKKTVRTACEIIPVLSTKKKVNYYIHWISALKVDNYLLCPNLDESINFFNSLFEMAPNPIYVMDKAGNALLANRKFYAITGYAPENITHKSIYDLDKSVKSKTQLKSLIEKIEQKGNVVFHGELNGSDGLVYPVEASLRQINLCGKQTILASLQDISQREKYQQEARYNKELRNLITKITNRFSLVNIKSFDGAANKALGDLGKFVSVDRSYLFRIEDNRLFVTNTHEWCSKYAKSEKDNLQRVSLEPFMWLLEHIEQNSYFALDRVDDLTDKYAEAREEFQREGIKSMLVVPLKRGGFVFGTIGFDAVDKYVKWDPIKIQLLTDFSNFIAQALDRRETLLLQEQKKRLEFVLTKKLLASTEEELAFFIKHVPSPIAMFDRETRYMAVSDRWLQDFSIKKRNIIGAKFAAIFKTDSVKWRNIFKRCLNGESLFSDKDRFVSATGKVEWIRWKVYPRMGHDNEINGIIMLSEVISERINGEERILHMMKYDMMTELPNRQYFREELSSILDNDKGKKYTLIMVSLDNMDVVNSYYNIFVGDKLIQEFAKKLKNILGKGSFLARFDGGQFAYIIKHASKQRINAFIKSIESLSAQIFDIYNYQIKITISAGVSSFSPGHISYEKLIKDIEIALHQAKQSSANNVVYFDAALEERYLRGLSLENDLQEALDKSQFYMVYQPLFYYKDDRTMGAEALIRWHHPHMKEVYPAEFIPLAEKRAKIVDIGYWILSQVFSDLKRILPKIKKYPHFVMSINLSPDQLLDKRFFTTLQDMIKRYNIPPHFLQFEITESRLSQNAHDVILVLAKIKSSGCKIAIDDFGIGHSSLERLRELPVSTLKIDKCFVDDVDKNEKSTSLVKHILMLASELKLSTVAEGIENKAQAHMLKFLGCDVGQGYYYSRPILFEVFEKKFLNHTSTKKSKK